MLARFVQNSFIDSLSFEVDDVLTTWYKVDSIISGEGKQFSLIRYNLAIISVNMRT